jgi:8-oxo-dGTP pyrophosphatase MutT (NUDIX family)
MADSHPTPLRSLNPQSVPVLGTDAHLPVVPLHQQSAQALRQRFSHPPIWVPDPFASTAPRPEAPVPAAVLVGIVQRDVPTVLLTQRTAHLPTHAGQIAFPGGRQDAQDRSPIETALREAQEEVGLDPRGVEVLGCLPESTTGSVYVITPVVALVQSNSELKANPGEVAEIFEVPLAHVLNPAHHRRHALQTDAGLRTWFSMPYQDGEQERFIWGATAAILRNLYVLLRA